MATAHQPTTSIVPTLARHEAALQQRLEQIAGEAREIVERARAEARQYEQAQENALAEKVSRLRQERHAARQSRFDQAVSSAQARLEGVREEAQRRVEIVADEVVRLFMPAGGGEA